MPQPGRGFSQNASKSYRFGFNGMENDNEVKGKGNSVDFGARIYDTRLSRWLSVDPHESSYPSLSGYSAFANNPINIIDPDGRDIVDSQGKHVDIKFNKNGTLSFSKNATSSIRRVANALNLTEAGKTQLRRVNQSEIHVKIQISSKVKIEKNKDGTTSNTFGETIQGNKNQNDNYGKIVNPDGSYGIKEASITIFEGTLKETNSKKHDGLSINQAIGAVAGHEIVHATDKKEINKDIKAELEGGNQLKEREKTREAVPNSVETKIIDQSKGKTQ